MRDKVLFVLLALSFVPITATTSANICTSTISCMEDK